MGSISVLTQKNKTLILELINENLEELKQIKNLGLVNELEMAKEKAKIIQTLVEIYSNM